MKKWIFVLGLVFGTTPLFANQPFYAGSGVGGLVVESDNFVAGGAGFNVFAGYRVNEYLNAEIQFMTASSLEDEPASISPQFITSSITAHTPISSNFNLYGRVGIAYWQADITLGQRSELDSSGTDITLGAGFELQYSRKIILRQEYQYVQMKDGGSQSLGFQFVYQF